MARKKDPIIKLPQPIDLRYKCVKNLWGKKKIVPTSISEQKRLKKTILKIFPDNLFYDDLHDENSVEPHEKETSVNAFDSPISLRYKCKRNLFGKRIQIATTISEQQKLKKTFIKLFPDGLFYDDLNEPNSIKPNQKSSKGIVRDISKDYFEYRLAKFAFEHTFDNDDSCDCNEHDSHDDCDCNSDD